MDIYQTEEQQVDAIKAFWKENGTGIIAGLVIGFGSFIGYGYYTEHQVEQEIKTAEAYQAVIENLGDEDANFTQLGEDFIAENETSAYASFTALALAKEAVTANNWEAAEKDLLIAIEKSSSDGVKAIAVTRLARVQIQLGKIDAALTTLETPLPASFISSVEEIKGDAYLKQDKVDLARNAYQAAINASGANVNPILQVKIDDISEVNTIVQ